MKYTETKLIKMTTDMKLGLEQIAEEQEVSTSWVIRKAITQYLDLQKAMRKANETQ